MSTAPLSSAHAPSLRRARWVALAICVVAGIAIYASAISPSLAHFYGYFWLRDVIPHAIYERFVPLVEVVGLAAGALVILCAIGIAFARDRRSIVTLAVLAVCVAIAGAVVYDKLTKALGGLYQSVWDTQSFEVPYQADDATRDRLAVQLRSIASEMRLKCKTDVNRKGAPRVILHSHQPELQLEFLRRLANVSARPAAESQPSSAGH